MTSAPIRTGIIGYGLSGRVFHEPFLAANPAFRIDLVSTSDASRQAAAAEKYAVVATPAELLARASDLDLIVLASPAHTHCEQALAALEAGAAVVIDKPFAASVAEAEQIISAAQRYKRPLAVYQNRRWDGDFLTVARLVQSGAVGEVHRFESTFERYGGPARARWQDTTTVSQGAGIVFDLGSHLVDQALRLFGPATLEHAEVRAIRAGSASDDDAFLSLKHEAGVLSHISLSRVAAQSGPRFRVLGSDAAYSVYGLDGQEALLRAGIGPGDPRYGVTPEADFGLLGGGVNSQLVPVPTERGDYSAFYEGMAAAILHGRPVPVDPRESLEAFRLLAEAHGL